MEVWFNPSCSKCRAATELLTEAGGDYVVRRYLDDPPDAAELRRVLDALGLEPWELARTGDPLARELHVAELPRERDRWVNLLAEHPRLLQRPILLARDGTAWVARDPETVRTALEHDRG